MNDNGLDIADLARIAQSLRPPIKPWTNPDTGAEQYLVIVHPAWFLALSPRDRWRIARSSDRAFKRYGFPMLPEWAVGKLHAVVFDEEIP